MRRTHPLPGNDNGKPVDHIVAATLALREAVKGQDGAAKMAKAILDLAPARRRYPAVGRRTGPVVIHRMNSTSFPVTSRTV